MEIQKVIERANQLLTEARYTKSRIYTYNWLWKKGIFSYMNSKSLVDFDEKVGKECTLCFHDGGSDIWEFEHSSRTGKVTSSDSKWELDLSGENISFEVNY